MFAPCRILPATCELCGNWLPDHQPSCPRNGVHPSQWTLNTSHLDHEMDYASEHQEENVSGDDDGVLYQIPVIGPSYHSHQNALNPI